MSLEIKVDFAEKIKAADIAGVFSYNLKFVDVDAIDNSSQGTFKVAGKVGEVGYTVFNPTDKTIKLTFTNYVYAPSVIKEQFTVKYNNVPQTITDIEVANNNNVLFTLTSSIKLHCKCCRINKLSISTY